VFLSSLGPGGYKKSLRDVVVFCFTGVGSTTIDGIKAVVVFVGRLAVVFVGRLSVLVVLTLVGLDFNKAKFTKAII
jgi:hypothetical protein